MKGSDNEFLRSFSRKLHEGLYKQYPEYKGDLDALEAEFRKAAQEAVDSI